LQDASGTLAFTSQIPANPVGGTGTANIIPKFTGGSTLGDSSLQNVSNSISNLNPPSGQFAWQLNGNATTGQSFGALVVAGTNASDIAFAVRNTGGVTTLFEVQGDGNVGIGTNSPDVTGFGWKTLTIKGGTASGEAGVLELQSPATTGAANLGIIAFLDGSNRNAQISGVRDGANNSGALSFVTWNAGTGAERFRIASTGAATFSSSVTAKTLTLADSAVIQIIQSTTGTNFNGLEFQNTGGSFYVGQDNSAGNFYGSNTAYSGCLYTSQNRPIVFSVNTIERARITSNGLTFNGDTAAANALDDYEEGTWTPIVKIGTTTNTASATNGTYVKIGRVVYINATITGITKSSSGGLTITNLPFTVSASGGELQGSMRWDDITSSGFLSPYFSSGNTQIIIQNFSNTGYVDTIQDTAIGSTYQLYGVTGFYYV
jgi:hypothetical protein